jgi:small subunit ribosomal protein S17
MPQVTNKPQAERKVVTMTGVVSSDKRDKTRTVVVTYMDKHAKYGKYIRKETVVQAHDENNQSKAGDTVEVGPCRPVSKSKTWKVLRVVTPGT